MSALPKRIASAVALLVIIFLVSYFVGKPGVLALGLLLCAGGTFEYQKIVFNALPVSLSLRILFLFSCFNLIGILFLNDPRFWAFWAGIVVTYFSVALWLLNDQPDNSIKLKILSLSGLGFLYAALLPTFALLTLKLEAGVYWFLLLCGNVFAGDVFAYFGGILWGQKKLMPAVSPNKTWAGAISGLIGSIFAGIAVQLTWLPHISVFTIIGLSLFSGFLAQNGDLFESLLKRVVDVKDSGRIMPGHGGILDRLDGLYFAAPVIYCAALYFN